MMRRGPRVECMLYRESYGQQYTVHDTIRGKSCLNTCRLAAGSGGLPGGATLAIIISDGYNSWSWVCHEG